MTGRVSAWRGRMEAHPAQETAMSAHDLARRIRELPGDDVKIAVDVEDAGVTVREIAQHLRETADERMVLGSHLDFRDALRRGERA